MRRGLAVAVGLAAVLTLSGCFGPDPQVAIDQASEDFDALVSLAGQTDEAVLRTLEVEPPVSESCDPKSEDRAHTVYVAAGTIAVGADDLDAVDILENVSSYFGGERWTIVADPPADRQEAWIDEDGITATATLSDGLVVIAVFSPCR